MGKGENERKRTKHTHVLDPVPREDLPPKIVLVLPWQAEVPPHQPRVSPHHTVKEENECKCTKHTHVPDPVPRTDLPQKIVLILLQWAEMPPH